MIETFDTNQILFFLLIMSITALFAGFFAGFFGIGGGIITVPCLFYIFGSVGIDKSFIMHLAVGTSFAIMIPTALMSVYTHYKHKAVDFDILKSYGIFVVTGVIIGSLIAAYLNTQSLVLKSQTKLKEKLLGKKNIKISKRRKRNKWILFSSRRT